MLLCTATLVAGNILFGDRRCILLSEEVMALVPKHVTVSLRMLMDHKAGSACEKKALIPIGQRRS